MSRTREFFERAQSLSQWFWAQILYWSGYSLLTLVAYTAPSGQFDWPLVPEILLQIVSGFFLTLPLSVSEQYLETKPKPLRFVAQPLLLLILAGIWTDLRIRGYLFFLHQPDWLHPRVVIGWWYFNSCFAMTIWIAVFYWVKAQQRLIAVEANAAYEAKMKMLRYQINPHFIFNAMNSIKSLVTQNKVSDAENMIDLFSGLLRTSIDADPPVYVPLHEEIEIANKYLAVEKVRFGGRLNINIDVAPEISNIVVPCFILQPIVENAVRYGVARCAKSCQIDIEAKAIESGLMLLVRDDGIGISSNKSSSDLTESGLGLHNVRSRLHLHYGELAKLELTAIPSGGTQVSIVLPDHVPKQR